MCLAQGHNTVMSVRLETTTPRQTFNHEPLRSLYTFEILLLMALSSKEGSGNSENKRRLTGVFAAGINSMSEIRGFCAYVIGTKISCTG